jgi:hypothetical protein
MEDGTIPSKKYLGSSRAEIHERFERTSVTLVERKSEAEPTVRPFSVLQDLRKYLEDPCSMASQPKVQLFVVKDLSREAVEYLGSRFDIDPHFFWAHIGDTSQWKTTPRLTVTCLRRPWFHIRNIEIRMDHSGKWEDLQWGTPYCNMARYVRHSRIKAPGYPNTISFMDTQTTIWTGKGELCSNATILLVSCLWIYLPQRDSFS